MSIRPEIESLFELVNNRTYHRGVSYYEDGAVGPLNIKGDTVTAIVNGSSRYSVMVGYENGEPLFSCSCPMGVRGDCCKHVVAVALKWNDSSSGNCKSDEKSRENKLMQYLRSLEKDELVQIVLSCCENDELLLNSLLVKGAGTKSGEDIDIGYVKKFITKSFTANDFVDYREAYAFAMKMNSAVDLLDQVLDAGHWVEAIDLAEYATKLADKACLSMDDSDGHMSYIFDRIQGIHVAACAKEKPEQEELANRLFGMACAASFGQFGDCLDVYHDILGEKGIGVFHALVESGWEKVPVKLPSENDHSLMIDIEEDKSVNRFVLTRFMEYFASRSGDIDMLIAVKSKDLSYAFNVIQISELLREAGRYKEAVGWLERGYKLFPDGHGRASIADEEIKVYESCANIPRALDLAWTQWVSRKSIDSCARIKRLADIDGSWEQWRQKLHDVLEKDLSAGTEGSGDTMVTTLLWEGQVEDAWKIASEYGCGEANWMQLAKAREAQFPMEVVGIFMRNVEMILRPRIPKMYAGAVNQLEHIGQLYKKAGKLDEFVKYCGEVRKKYKQLRNFMKAMDESRVLQQFLGNKPLTN